jgi:hypothetical protein
MRLVARSLVVLIVGVVLSLGLLVLANTYVKGPFGGGGGGGGFPGAAAPDGGTDMGGFVKLMGVWRALGGAAPNIDVSAFSGGGAPGTGAGGVADLRRQATEARDRVNLAQAWSDGGRYAILLGLGTFVGIVIEAVWMALLRKD